MRRLLNQPWFAGTLALLAISLIGWRLLPEFFARYETRNYLAPSAASEASGAGEPLAALPSVQPPIAALLQALPAPGAARDPFAARPRMQHPAASPTPANELVDTLHLSALWTEHSTTLVLINGRIWQRGDTIGRLRIADASQEGVWVTHENERDFIPLGGDFTLRTPASPDSAPVALN